MSFSELGYVLLGLTLVLFVFTDALWTTLWVDGGSGPLTFRLNKVGWRLFHGLARGNKSVLSLYGPLALLATIVAWVLLLWIGWLLAFSADPQSVLHGKSGAAAAWPERVYFVGYTVFTLGNGEFVPNGSTWQLATAIASGSGMFLVTLSITYLPAVISAAVNARTFAAQVNGLGDTPATIVANAWNAHDLRSINLPLNGLASQLATVNEQYSAYPVLQFFHVALPRKSALLNAALLDEVLTILEHGVGEQVKPDVAVIRSARAAVSGLLHAMPDALTAPASEAPSLPNLDPLRMKGIVTAADSEFASAVQGLATRRCSLLALVRNHGWKWADLQGAP